MMKTKSAEDKRRAVLRSDNGRLGVLLLAVLIVVALSISLYSTQFSINDTDPTTYVIIPMLMLPVFALFFMKDKIVPKVGRKDITIALLLFAALVVATAYLRVLLSYSFTAYRIDMLLFPVLIASFIALIFGIGNIKRFLPLMIYSIFASPLLLMPIIMANGAFAAANTQIVYHMLSIFIPNATYSAPITIIANNYRIGIGESCVGVGLLIAIVLLLIPVAYLYRGTVKRKILWILSGLGLLFLLNILRMSSIAVLWITSGPTSALSLFHSVAGILLFYAVVVIIILVSSLYGIGIAPKSRRTERTHGRSTYGRSGIVLAVLVLIVYILLNAQFSNAAYVSPYLNAVQQGQHAGILGLEAGLSNTTYLYGSIINSTNNSFTMKLYSRYNTSITSNTPILLHGIYTGSDILPEFSGSNVVDELSFIDGNGIRQDSYYVISNNTPFIYFETSMPYYYNSSYQEVTFYAIVPASSIGSWECNAGYDYAYSAIFNDLNGRFYNATVEKDITAGECIIGGALSEAV